MKFCHGNTTPFLLAVFIFSGAVAEAQVAPLPNAQRPGDPPVRVAVRWNPRDDGVPAVPASLGQDETGPSGGTTLADLEAIALANNPTLMQARMAIRAAQGEWQQAGLYPNPVVGYQGEEIGDDSTAGQQGAFVAQQVVTAGKLRLGQAVASHRVEQARYAWQSQQQRVLSDVRAGFYEVILAQRTVDLNGQLAHIGDEGVSAAEQLFDALEVSQADVLQAQIESDSAKIRLNSAQNRHLAAWRRLTAVLGTPQMELTALAGDVDDRLPDRTWQETLEQLLAESPQLAEARARVNQARCALEWECARRVPNVDLLAAVRYNNASDETVTSLEVGLPLPLFNRNQGNITRAQAELIAAKHEVRRLELELCERLADAFNRYADARTEVEIYSERLLDNAEKSLELVRTGYREGEFDYLTLLTAQRTYFRVNLSYLGSLSKLWASRIAIEGMLLGGGLRQTASAGSLGPVSATSEAGFDQMAEELAAFR